MPGFSRIGNNEGLSDLSRTTHASAAPPSAAIFSLPAVVPVYRTGQLESAKGSSSFSSNAAGPSSRPNSDENRDASSLSKNASEQALSPGRAATVLAATVCDLNLNHVNALKSFPDNWRLPYLLEVAHTQSSGHATQLPESLLKEVPVYRQATPPEQALIRNIAGEAGALKQAVGNPQAQKRHLQSLDKLMQSVPLESGNLQELRYATASFIANQLDHLGENRELGIEILRKEFAAVRPEQPWQAECRSEALCLVLESSMEHLAATHLTRRPDGRVKIMLESGLITDFQIHSSALKQAVGDPQAQKRHLQSLNDLLRSIPSEPENMQKLRYATASFIATQLDYLGENRELGIEILRKEFTAVRPDPEQPWQSECRSEALCLVLKSLPDHLRTPFLLHTSSPGKLQQAELDLIPLYRDAEKDSQDVCREKLETAISWMVLLEDAKGKPDQQEKRIKNLTDFAERLETKDGELRYAIFTAIASKFEWLDGTKLNTIKMLREEFKASTPKTPAQQQWRADAVSTMLNSSIQFAKSNYTAKEAVNLWRDEMIRPGLSDQHRFEITRNLIRALPTMDATAQSFTSKYSPQAKAVKYLHRLLAHHPEPLLKGGNAPSAMPAHYHAQLVHELQQVLPELDSSRRNPSQSSISGRSTVWGTSTSAAVIGGGSLALGVVGTTAVTVASGGVLLGVGAAVSVGAFLATRQKSNQSTAQQIIFEAMAPRSDQTKKQTQLGEQPQLWAHKFRNFNTYSAREQKKVLNDFGQLASGMKISSDFGAKAVENAERKFKNPNPAPGSGQAGAEPTKYVLAKEVEKAFSNAVEEIKQLLRQNNPFPDANQNDFEVKLEQFVAHVWTEQAKLDAALAVFGKVGSSPEYDNHSEGAQPGQALIDEIQQAKTALLQEFVNQVTDAFYSSSAAAPAFVALAQALPHLKETKGTLSRLLGSSKDSQEPSITTRAKDCLRKYLEPTAKHDTPMLDVRTFEIIDNALRKPGSEDVDDRYHEWRTKQFGHHVLIPVN